LAAAAAAGLGRHSARPGGWHPARHELAAGFRLIEWPLLRRGCAERGGLVFMLCFTSFAVVLTLGGGHQQHDPDSDLSGRALQSSTWARRSSSLLQVAICAVLAAVGQRFVHDVR
jgi:thiamine transport system permease protein